MIIVRLILQYPNGWLKKHLDIEDIAVSFTAQQSPSDSESPMIRTRALRLTVLAPVFAVLADRAVAGQTTAAIDIILEPVIATVSSQQVAWLKTFAQMMPSVIAARGTHHVLVCMYAVMILLQLPLLAVLPGTTKRLKLPVCVITSSMGCLQLCCRSKSWLLLCIPFEVMQFGMSQKACRRSQAMARKQSRPKHGQQSKVYMP